MFQELYDLLLNSIFGGTIPSPLMQYFLEFFTLICICLVVGIPFFIVYGIWRRYL